MVFLPAPESTTTRDERARETTEARPIMAMTNDGSIAKNVRRIGHLDIPGGGQIMVRGDIAVIGFLDPPKGTAILDVSNPAAPRIISEITLDGMASHSHKARFAGDRDLLLVNSEMHDRHVLRKGLEVAASRAAFRDREGRDPSDRELAGHLKVPVDRMPDLFAIAETGYADGERWQLPGFVVITMHHSRTTVQRKFIHRYVCRPPNGSP